MSKDPVAAKQAELDKAKAKLATLKFAQREKEDAAAEELKLSRLDAELARTNEAIAQAEALNRASAPKVAPAPAPSGGNDKPAAKAAGAGEDK